jgi:hypothetical protein
LRRVIILVAVIIAVPVMMWTITIFIRSYVPGHVGRPRASEALLTDAGRTAGDGLASLPDRSLKGPLALPAVDAPPPAASPTGPAETAPNAPAAASGGAAPVTETAPNAPATASGEAAPITETAPNAPAAESGEAAAVTDSARSAATAETASSEAVSPEAIRGSIPLQRDRLTATGSMAYVGPIPLPRVRPVDAPVDTPPVPSLPLSDSPLLAHPAPYSGPGSDSAH